MHNARTVWARGIALSVATMMVGGCGGTAEKPPTLPTLGATKVMPGEFGRNVVRIGGLSPTDVAGAAVMALYSRDQPPAGWVLAADGDWRSAIIGAQFAAGPVYAGVLPIKADYLPTAADDVLRRIKPPGFPKGHGLQALVLGHGTRNLFGDVDALGLKPSLLKAPSADRLALDTVPYRGGFAGAYSDSVVIVSNEARDYALPAAAWSAYSGDTVAFVHRDRVPAATRALLMQRRKLRVEQPSIYVVGPSNVVSDAVLGALRRYGPVKRIGGTTPAEVSVALARFHDPKTGFGWGIKHGPASVSLVNRRTWGNAVAALSFAARGPQAPLLLLDRAGSLPAPVASYLRDLGAKGPSQAFAFGDRASIASGLLTRVDTLMGRQAGA